MRAVHAPNETLAASICSSAPTRASPARSHSHAAEHKSIVHTFTACTAVFGRTAAGALAPSRADFAEKAVVLIADAASEGWIKDWVKVNAAQAHTAFNASRLSSVPAAVPVVKLAGSCAI